VFPTYFSLTLNKTEAASGDGWSIRIAGTEPLVFMRSPTSPTRRLQRHSKALALHNRTLRIICENSEEASHGPAGWGGQIQRLSQRNEPDTEMFQFLERGQ
jgi:hypothetical protein